jgi:ATP-dependent helicase/nuclease subunit A
LHHEAQRLCAAQFLSAAETEALDLAALAQFWQSKLGQRIRANASHVQREVPFTLRLTRKNLKGLPLLSPPFAVGEGKRGRVAAEVSPELIVTSIPDGEYVVLQGVVDLAVLLPHEIWLVDFKTDDLKPAELEERRKFYAPQLKLYALALERILRRPVTERWLYFLSLRESVSV